MQPGRKKQQFSQCWRGQQAVENPCKVFPGTRACRSLGKYLNVGIEKYSHTFLNEIEQSWETPGNQKTEAERGNTTWESHTAGEWSQSKSQALVQAALCTHRPLAHLVLTSGATAQMKAGGELHCSLLCCTPDESHAKGQPAKHWFSVLQESFLF